MVVPTFVQQALRGVPITVYGDGDQSRCFTHVADAVAALERLSQHNEAIGQVYNIGNSEVITIAELARVVKSMTGSNSEICYIPYDEAYEEGFEDMPRRVPDISKIRALVGYEPTRSLETIIRDVIDFSEHGELV